MGVDSYEPVTDEMVEAVTDDMLSEAVSVCENYRKVMSQQEEAEQNWRNLLRMAEEAPVQREKQMYNRMADDAIKVFSTLKAWTDRAVESVSLIPSYKAYLVIKQYYFEGRTMSDISGIGVDSMSRATADRYKKIGLRMYAAALYEYDRRKKS